MAHQRQYRKAETGVALRLVGVAVKGQEVGTAAGVEDAAAAVVGPIKLRSIFFFLLVKTFSLLIAMYFKDKENKG